MYTNWYVYNFNIKSTENEKYKFIDEKKWKKTKGKCLQMKKSEI